MKHPYLHGVASALLVLAVGCVGSGQAGYSASATYTAPELILIEPDIQVVADYDEPVFYTDNYYWRYDNGLWYRSNNHLNGWVQFEAIPPRLRRIERPTAYVHYHGDARVTTTGPQVRDHRDNQPPPPPPVARPMPPAAVPPPPPVQQVPAPPPQRDLKQERKDDRKDMKEERKDDRKDVKEERKDAKKDAKEERKDEHKDEHHNGKKK